MKKLSRAARILAAAGLTLGLIGLAAPANAERYSIDDPADAAGSNNDILELTYVHGAENVRFVITVADLRAASTAGATLFLDTKPKRKGPEFGLGTGLGSGTDYALFRTKGWKSTGNQPVDCDYQLRLRYKTDRVVGTISRECLNNPTKIAGAVKMVDNFDPSHPIRDWAPGTRTFGQRVAAG